MRASTNYLVDEFKEKEYEDFFDEIHCWYTECCKKNSIYGNHLTYAWDHQSKSNFYEFLKSSVQDTNILVVIGYSFPFFNREIDKMILGVDFMPRLEKAYFQIPEKRFRKCYRKVRINKKFCRNCTC